MSPAQQTSTREIETEKCVTHRSWRKDTINLSSPVGKARQGAGRERETHRFWSTCLYLGLCMECSGVPRPKPGQREQGLGKLPRGI